MNIKQFIYDNIVYPLFRDQIEVTAIMFFNSNNAHLEAELATAYTFKDGLVKAYTRDKLAEATKIELGFDPTKSREAMIKAGLLVDGEPTGKVIKLMGDIAKRELESPEIKGV